jgi:hypothetical protein
MKVTRGRRVGHASTIAACVEVENVRGTMKGILTPHILHIVLVSRPFTRPSGLRAMSDKSARKDVSERTEMRMEVGIEEERQEVPDRDKLKKAQVVRRKTEA